MAVVSQDDRLLWGDAAAFADRALGSTCAVDRTVAGQDAAGAGFAYADAHRARLGVNYRQIPVNAPKSEVHSYSKDGAMRIHNVYAPNSYGGPQADPARAAEVRWHADGEMVRTASRCAPTTMTGARQAFWCVRSWTSQLGTAWLTTLSDTSQAV